MIEPKTGPTYAESAKGIMNTRGGTKFDLLFPRADDVFITDIAIALGKICRFTGHSSTFYSVAEHSVKVYRCVRQWANDPNLWLAALMHDAAEAYLGDVAKPIKDAMRALTIDGVSGYDILEARVMGAIAQRYGFPTDSTTKAIIKRADNVVYIAEAMEYMRPGWGEHGYAQSYAVATHEFAKAFSEIVHAIREKNRVAA